MVQVYIVVEGNLDEAVARRLVCVAGGQPGPIYGKEGKSQILQKINGYNNAARWAPWFVLVDLDRDAPCAPPFCQKYLSEPARWMCFRIAVRSIESWLLADRQNIAQFLHVSLQNIPHNPENLPNPKKAIINLARRSRSGTLRRDLVPTGGARVGPAYTSRLIEFVQGHWNPSQACRNAPSLNRAIQCLHRIIKHYSHGQCVCDENEHR